MLWMHHKVNHKMLWNETAIIRLKEQFFHCVLSVSFFLHFWLNPCLEFSLNSQFLLIPLKLPFVCKFCLQIIWPCHNMAQRNETALEVMGGRKRRKFVWVLGLYRFLKNIKDWRRKLPPLQPIGKNHSLSVDSSQRRNM